MKKYRNDLTFTELFFTSLVKQTYLTSITLRNISVPRIFLFKRRNNKKILVQFKEQSHYLPANEVWGR